MEKPCGSAVTLRRGGLSCNCERQYHEENRRCRTPKAASITTPTAISWRRGLARELYRSAPARPPATAGLRAHRADGRCDRQDPRRGDWTAANLEANLMNLKGWDAYGATDPDERTRALDMLGFNCQLVFASIAPGQFWGSFAQREHDAELLYGGARALNRAMVDFCAHDKRLDAGRFRAARRARTRRAGNRGSDAPRLPHGMDSGGTGG